MGGGGNPAVHMPSSYLYTTRTSSILGSTYLGGGPCVCGQPSSILPDAWQRRRSIWRPRRRVAAEAGAAGARRGHLRGAHRRPDLPPHSSVIVCFEPAPSSQPTVHVAVQMQQTARVTRHTSHVTPSLLCSLLLHLHAFANAMQALFPQDQQQHAGAGASAAMGAAAELAAACLHSADRVPHGFTRVCRAFPGGDVGRGRGATPG